MPVRELDAVIDMVMACLLKKATDTNHFVSEQADKALAMVCHACTESKVFMSLQNVTAKSAPMKLKITICYGNLCSKLG